MAVRHRISFRGEQRPWTGERRDAEPVQFVDLDPGPPPSARPRPAGRPVGPRLDRHWALALVLVLVGLAFASTVLDRPDAPPAEAPEEESVTVPDFGVMRPAGPTWIPTEQVVAAPLRGTMNRYWPSAEDLETRRVHIWFLDDLAAWSHGGEGRRALLIADPTRRAQVSGDADGRLPAVRRMDDAAGSVVVREWDRPGWGFSMLTVGVADSDAEALVAGGIDVPPGASLAPSAPPTVDPSLLDRLGFEVRWTRRARSTVVGAPLIGQGGLDTIEGYLYAPGPVDTPGPILVSATLERAVTATDLAALVGATAPGSSVAGHAAIGLDLELDAPVGFRLTGASRLVFDHDYGVTFELVADSLDVDGLRSVAELLDFDRLARLLRPL